MDEPHIDQFGQSEKLTVNPAFMQLMDEPMVKVRLPYGEPSWLATRYDDVRTVLGDPRFSRAAVVSRDEPRNTPTRAAEGLLAMDPPQHTRMRGLVARAFTGRRVEQLRPKVTQISNELVDGMLHGRAADLVEDFATPLPVRVICELLGVPTGDQGRFRVWSEAFVSTTAIDIPTLLGYREKLFHYMADLLAKRRQHPEDDLLTAMARASDESEEPFSESDLVKLASGLLVAGHETTVVHISNFVYVLLTHPEQLAWLRSNLDKIPGAVEELMRFIPLGVTTGLSRYATEDVELGGVTMKAGEAVAPMFGTANLDERAFPGAAQLDLSRTPNQHLGFGHGAHHCLGAPLARMELQVALDVLLTRLPELALAVPEADLTWKEGLMMRGLTAMPITW